MKACTMASGGVMFIPDTVEGEESASEKEVVNYRSTYQKSESSLEDKPKRLFGRKPSEKESSQAA